MENIIKRRLTGVSSLKTLLMATLILFACHDIYAGDAYDSDSRASEDLGYFVPVSDSSNEFPTLQNLKANNEKCSETCDPTITFENKGCRTVEIYLYHSGHFTHYKTLAPGGVHEQPADKYDVWAVYTSSGSYLGCYFTGCYDDYVNIHSGGSIHVNAGHNRSICRGESVQLCATGANHYQWSNGQTGACITVSPHDDTNYSVTGTSNGCSDTDHVSIHVDKAKWDHVNKGQDTDCGSCNGSIIVDGNYNATGKFTVEYTYNGQTYSEGSFTTPSDIVINHLCPGVYADITIIGVHTGCEDVWSHDIVIEELGCCPDSISGGIIFLPDAIGDALDITLTRCFDNPLDSLRFSGVVGDNSIWVITDENSNIISLQNYGPFDFSSFGPGTYSIWRLAYDEIQGLVVGANLDDLEGCFDFSNAIIVEATECCEVDGGIIFFPDAIGNNVGDTLSRCLDRPLDSLRFSGVVAANSIWGVTDENGNIISLQNYGPFDFSSFGPGDYTIWRLAYDEIEGLAIGANLADLEGCFDFSNSLTFDVTCCSPSGGPVDCVCEEEGGIIGVPISPTVSVNLVDICIDDGFPDPLDITIGFASGTNFAWLITDEDFNILELPDAPPFDLDNGLGEGVYLIWYLAYEYVQGLTVGENVNDLRGCYDLSSQIVVTATCCDEDGLPIECQVECEDYTLDFNDPHTDWHKYSTSGSYTIGNQTFDINIDDDDHILQYTDDSDSGISIGIDPLDRHDEVVITYEFSEVASSVVFDIVDLDRKHPKQQEKVCVYGLLGDDDTQILPNITSLDGSVAISGNCATATTSSSYGHDESVLVEFTECIDQVVIVYGSGPNAPHNPDYSRIYIGRDYGFTADVCPSLCQGSIEPREDESYVADVSIFPNPAHSASFVTLSIESELQGTANVVVIDALGRTVSNSLIQLTDALTEYNIDVSRLNSGVYFVTLVTQEGRSKAQQLVIVRQ